MNQLQNVISSIIHKRLTSAPQEIKGFFPTVLKSSNIPYFAYSTDRWFMLSLNDNRERDRIGEMLEKKYQPHPGLFAADPKAKAAFTVSKSKYLYIDSCTVNNTPSFSSVEDSTVVLCNHKQSIMTDQFGLYEYTVPLAYILGFGEEINQENYLKFLDDLVAYSIGQWRSAGVR